MSSTNVNVMVKEAVRALKANNKAEARTLLEKATELDPYNEQAWLWLSGVVETEADQQTCLQNVLFINPGNENAKQGLAMLEAKLSAKPKSEPRPSNPSAFDDFELPESDNWLSELDEMRQSATTMPTTNPFNMPIDEDYDATDDAFADPFGDPFGASADGPFSANTDLPAIPPPPASNAASSRSSDFEDDLDSLFGGDGPPSAPVASPTPETKKSGKRDRPAAKKPDPLENIPDDADAGTLFGIIPDEIRASSLPGVARKAPVMMRLLFAALILGNVALVALIFTKVTMP
jgi:hypothetical protein